MRLPGTLRQLRAPYGGSTACRMVVGAGFEPAKLARQIYSLIPLTAREPLLKEPGIFFATHKAVNRNIDIGTGDSQ